jgi:epoxyqueuosine reductase
MKTSAETAWIVTEAQELGFALCGVAALQGFPEHQEYKQWLARGYAGEMAYLSDPRRSDPTQVVKGARSVIVCALNYNTPHPYSSELTSTESGAPRGWISRYAWGRDYHEVMWERLNALAQKVKGRFAEEHISRAYADTGPISERIFAKHAGLGWLGKNTLLLNEEFGSWLFLGVILTTLDLAPSLRPAEAAPADLCGNCRQCLDACPTGALVEPYLLDARRCISYLTIELRGSVPEQLRQPIGQHVYGCDICQQVCPYNREAPLTNTADFRPRSWSERESLLGPSLEWLATMAPEEFREKFRGSALKRTKWKGLVRNACIALGNAKLAPESMEWQHAVKLLEQLSHADDQAITESARWALWRIQRSAV